jgi:hypothetical protein
MSKINELFAECKTRNYNVSLTYQGINAYSVEIYTGYKQNHKLVAFVDGSLTAKGACKKALKLLRKAETNTKTTKCRTPELQPVFCEKWPSCEECPNRVKPSNT